MENGSSEKPQPPDDRSAAYHAMRRACTCPFLNHSLIPITHAHFCSWRHAQEWGAAAMLDETARVAGGGK